VVFSDHVPATPQLLKQSLKRSLQLATLVVPLGLLRVVNSNDMHA